eukprot:jgi/Galph1/5627/GphlegSOOS_G4218.1
MAGISRQDGKVFEAVDDELSTDESPSVSDDELEHKLLEDAMESKGLASFKLADQLRDVEEQSFVTQRVRCSRLSPTCVAVSKDEKLAVVGSKDQSVNVFDLVKNKKIHKFFGIRSGEKPGKLKGHHGQVLCCCVSEDGNMAYSGGADNYIKVWDLRSKELVTSLSGHRAAVTGVVRVPDSREMYSCSVDRCVKVWNLENLSYVDSLFGHEAPISSISSAFSGMALTGGSDRTLRLWKVNEDSQLIFRGHNGSIDSVAFVNGKTFVSGSEDGSLALWSRFNKKPVLYVHEAHSEQRNLDTHPSPLLSSRLWISAVSTIAHSDLIASGSSSGRIHLWKCSEKSLEFLSGIKAAGFVNGLVFGSSRRLLVAVHGQEHRLGRWYRLPNSKNILSAVRMPLE